jgi:hypothetical protein
LPETYRRARARGRVASLLFLATTIVHALGFALLERWRGPPDVQPVLSQARRIVEARNHLGEPFAAAELARLTAAQDSGDGAASRTQTLTDCHDHITKLAKTATTTRSQWSS